MNIESTETSHEAAFVHQICTIVMRHDLKFTNLGVQPWPSLPQEMEQWRLQEERESAKREAERREMGKQKATNPRHRLA